MIKKYDASVKTGTYQNNKGEQKGRYLTVGAVFERHDGTVCMKLEALPIGFDGWINFYEPKFKEAKDAVERAEVKTSIPEGFEDQIPFNPIGDL